MARSGVSSIWSSRPAVSAANAPGSRCPQQPKKSATLSVVSNPKPPASQGAEQAGGVQVLHDQEPLAFFAGGASSSAASSSVAKKEPDRQQDKVFPTKICPLFPKNAVSVLECYR